MTLTHQRRMHPDLMKLHEWIYPDTKIEAAATGSRDIDTASGSGGSSTGFPGLTLKDSRGDKLPGWAENFSEKEKNADSQRKRSDAEPFERF